MILGRMTPSESDLAWLFNRSDADCGISSNYGSMVSAIILGPSARTLEDPYTERVIENVAKRRRIEEAFYSLSTNHQKTLFVVHAFVRIHPYVEKMLGQKGGVCYLFMDPDKLEALCTKACQGQLAGHEKIGLSQLRTKQENEYKRALEAFNKVYRRK